MVKPYRCQVFVCTASGTGAEMQTAADPCRNRFCSDKGGEAIRAHFWTALEAAGVDDVKVTRMGCTVQHARGPIVIVYPDGIWYAGVTVADVDEIVRDHLVRARPVERLILHRMDAQEPNETGEVSMTAPILAALTELPGDPEETAGLCETERLAQQKTRHTARRARAKAATRKGLLVVYTGKGKGKTTAAVGLLVRAWGQGLRVCMLQFIKARTGKWGEIQATKKFGIELLPLGDGFTWLSQNIEGDKAIARQGWDVCRARILSGAYDFIVLDELTYMLKYHWLTWDEIRETLDQRPAGMHIVITGRYAPQELIDHADLVTEMTEIKHHYRAGIKAQKGIEF